MVRFPFRRNPAFNFDPELSHLKKEEAPKLPDRELLCNKPLLEDQTVIEYLRNETPVVYSKVIDEVKLDHEYNEIKEKIR